MTIADLLAFEPDAREKYDQVWLGYTESKGGIALRNEISKLYESINPEEILVHTGAGEAIYLFMQAYLNPGDHIIVHSPGYQSLTEVARGLGCEISLWVAHEENNWVLDLSELPTLLRKSTKLIVLNTPHNPTGYLMSNADFKAIQNFANQNSLLLFSDEVYRESEYEPATRLPAACDGGEQNISLGVLSKTFGLAGLRVGWIATKNRQIYNSISALKDYTTICNSAPSEFLAEVAIRNHKKLAERNLNIIRNNLSILDSFFQVHSEHFSWIRPRAGSMAFPRLLDGDVEAFCEGLVREAGVLLLPGTVFDDRENHFRLGIGRQNLPQAISRLIEYMS
jgi:aspartate/methionine/tyrosine aminotransferase